MTNSQTPLLITIVLLSIALQFIVNNTIRPAFNEVVRRYNHHKLIQSRQAEWYAGLGLLMSSEHKPGLL